MNRDNLRKELLGCLDAVYAFALKLSKDPETSDDLVQECYSRALNRLDMFQKNTSIKPILFKILRNLYIDKIRSQQRGPVMMSLDQLEDQGTIFEDPSYSTFSHRLIQESFSENIQDTLNKIPDEYREILFLREIEELSYQEISEIVQAPIGTIRSRLSRARATFLKTLHELESTEEVFEKGKQVQ